MCCVWVWRGLHEESLLLYTVLPIIRVVVGWGIVSPVHRAAVPHMTDQGMSGSKGKDGERYAFAESASKGGEGGGGRDLGTPCDWSLLRWRHPHGEPADEVRSAVIAGNLAQYSDRVVAGTAEPFEATPTAYLFNLARDLNTPGTKLTAFDATPCIDNIVRLIRQNDGSLKLWANGVYCVWLIIYERIHLQSEMMKIKEDASTTDWCETLLGEMEQTGKTYDGKMSSDLEAHLRLMLHSNGVRVLYSLLGGYQEGRDQLIEDMSRADILPKHYGGDPGAYIVTAVCNAIQHSNHHSVHYPGDEETQGEMDAATQVVAMSLVDLFQFRPETIVIESGILGVICDSMRTHYNKPLFRAHARVLFDMVLPLFDGAYEIKMDGDRGPGQSVGREARRDETVVATLFPARQERSGQGNEDVTPERKDRRASLGESSAVVALIASAEKGEGSAGGGGKKRTSGCLSGMGDVDGGVKRSCV